MIRQKNISSEEIASKLEVDCSLVADVVNPIFCFNLLLLPNGEVIWVHKNAELYPKEILLTICELLEGEAISAKDRKKIEEVKKVLLSPEKEETNQETSPEPY